MNVSISDSAYADILDIGRFIARDKPGRAATFIDELFARCLGLGGLPTAFPLVPKWEKLGVRRRPYGNYLIFYRINAETVEILHVLHGAADYEAILFPA